MSHTGPIKNNSTLRTDEKDMLELIQKSPYPGRKDALTACYLLNHGDLLKKIPSESARREYLGDLYERMRPLSSSRGPTETLFRGKGPRTSLLLSHHSPKTKSPSHDNSSHRRPRPLTVEGLDQRIRNLAHASLKSALGPELLSSPALGGHLTFTATFEEGERVKIEVTENLLEGLHDDQREAVERALKEIEFRLPRPRVGMTEIRTHYVKFGPISR